MAAPTGSASWAHEQQRASVRASEGGGSGDASDELLFADVTLRAEGDGATARAHRGVLAALSGVFREALLVGSSGSGGGGSEEHRQQEALLPLPGKTRRELQLLLGWMYQSAAGELTRVRPSTSAPKMTRR
jgi:hypothetical protein